jgi:hypothetical protein
MDANELYAIENVVRVVFPQTMINEGELLPAAFKLRERADGPEQYISVFRQYAESFSKDILSFDKQRNLPCCIMNVGEITKIELEIADNQINYKVKAVPTENYTSHAGIFTYLGGIIIEGDGKNAFSSFNIGSESKFHLIAIRRRLVEIAKKRMTTVSQIVKQ